MNCPRCHLPGSDRGVHKCMDDKLRNSNGRVMVPDERIPSQRQIWFCDTCHSMGILLYEKHDGVYEIATRVNAAHDRRHCDASPRVLVPENIHEDTVLLLPVGRLV